MLLFLLLCQWRVCKIVCNFQHYFGGRSKWESSCLEIRSSARFLLEIWISYFARRILEGVFVGGIVNIRNECLFSRFMGNESQCGTNKSHENRFAVHAICLFRTAIHFPWTEKKDTHSLSKYTNDTSTDNGFITHHLKRDIPRHPAYINRSVYTT